MSTLLEPQIGWRGACYAWAALHLLVGLPLNLLLPKPQVHVPRARTPVRAGAATSEPAATRCHAGAARLRAARLRVRGDLVHQHRDGGAPAAAARRLNGATLATAVAVGALVGPAQVAGRLLEFGVLRRVHPLLSARLAAVMHPLGAALLLLVGAPAAALFAMLHGAGNGILTIAKGTLPLVLFGPQGYGHRQGLLMIPARIAQASAPWLFGLCLDRFGAGALWLSGSIGLLAFGALLALPRPAEVTTSAAGSIVGRTST